MSKMPFFKQFPSDFIAGVAGMTAEQIGVYSILYNMMYARRKRLECASAKDQQGLARACGCTTRRFNQVLAELEKIPSGKLGYKIMRDAEGRLTNPRFERMIAADPASEEPAENVPPKSSHIEGNQRVKPGRGRATENPPKPAAQPRQGDLSQIFEEINPRLSRRDVAPKSSHIEQDQQLNPGGSHATTRAPATQKPDSKNGTQGGAAAPPRAAAAHDSNPASFNQWVQACRRTIPKGSNLVRAAKQWEKLPHQPVDIWIATWDRYIANNREKSKTAKFPQKTHNPENWFKDRIYQDFLDEELDHRIKAEAKAAARAAALTAWGEHGAAIVAKIGEAKFDAWLLDATFTITAPQQAILEIPKLFALKYLREHGAIIRAIESVTNTAITLTQQQRQTA